MRILVVDDEQDVRTLFEQRFRKEIKAGKVEFSFAHSGQEALTYLQREACDALLILSDINMPGMSGLELLERIKQKGYVPPPTVMMVTAYGDEENHRRAMQLGADDFLTKPLDFRLLREKLHLENT